MIADISPRSQPVIARSSTRGESRRSSVETMAMSDAGPVGQHAPEGPPDFGDRWCRDKDLGCSQKSHRSVGEVAEACLEVL